MESVDHSKQNNAFLSYLLDCVCKTKTSDQEPEVSTIDGDIISQNELHAALKTGNGVMIGDFFVGSTHSSELDFGYSLSL